MGVCVDIELTTQTNECVAAYINHIVLLAVRSCLMATYSGLCM